MLLRILPRQWIVDPRPLRSVGMLVLVAAITWPRFAPGSLTEDVRDASQGFLFGIAIAILLWSVVIRKRAKR